MGAVWLDVDGSTIRCAHPDSVEIPSELLGIATRTLHPEVFPLRSLVPSLETQYPDADLLVLPLLQPEPSSGTVALIGSAGAFGEEFEPWEQLGAALTQVAQQRRSLQDAENEIEILRQRAEESEALHTLGLVANWTESRERSLSKPTTI